MIIESSETYQSMNHFCSNVFNYVLGPTLRYFVMHSNFLIQNYYRSCQMS